jgi:hypothetical protein
VSESDRSTEFSVLGKDTLGRAAFMGVIVYVLVAFSVPAGTVGVAIKIVVFAVALTLLCAWGWVAVRERVRS